MVAWTTPRTWTDGEVQRTSWWNTGLRDNLLYLRREARYTTADQTTTSTSSVAVTGMEVLGLEENSVWVVKGHFFWDASPAKIVISASTINTLSQVQLWIGPATTTSTNIDVSTWTFGSYQSPAVNGSSVRLRAVFAFDNEADHWVKMFFRSTTGGTVTFKAGSWLVAERVV